MNLRQRENEYKKALASKHTDAENHICFMEMVSVLNEISEKLDRLESIEARLSKIESSPHQSVMVQQQIPTMNDGGISLSNEPAFIPTLHTDDLQVKGKKAVKTTKKKRNLSGAAKSLNKVTKESG